MLIIELENASHHLATVLQYFKQEADAKKQSAVIPLQSLSDYFNQQGMAINPDTIKNLLDTDPEIKNLIKSFDGEKITINTVVEPSDSNSEIKSTDQVGQMAKRALKKRS